MSKLTDKISYLQGLAEGMKLNPDKDTHRLILGILDALGDVGDTLDALVEAQGEMVERINEMDDELTGLEDDFYDDEYDPDEDEFDVMDDEDSEDGEEDTDEDEEAGEAELPDGPILYECPHCHTTVEIDPDSVDLSEESLCPSCGKELFPEALGE